MTALFAEFVIPGLIQSTALLAWTGIVVALLYGLRPLITERTVIAFVPWVVTGAALHVFYQLGDFFDVQLFPGPVAELFAAPAVYLVMFNLMSLIWIVATMVVPSGDRDRRIALYLGVIGFGIMIPIVGLLLRQGFGLESGLQPILPILGFIGALVLTVVVYILVGLWRTDVFARARITGGLVIFAHLFDGLTTALGVDVLGAGERSAVPRMIMDFAADLPTAETLGTGWLFVLVKVVIAVAIVVLFADYVDEEPTSGNLFFSIIIAVGLGPGMNNFFLFMLGIGV